MNTLSVINSVASLYKIVEAGERGYAVAASNVSNRALKILFRSHAQQRLTFQDELFAEMRRLGRDAKPRSILLGAIHRGRIDIFTALTIGTENREKVVLKEVLLGEGVALRAYKRILKKDLPPETRIIVERQLQEILKIVDEIRLMRGRNGKRLLVQLYDSESDVEQTLLSLNNAGVSKNEVEIEDSGSITSGDLYDQGRGTTIFETIISGAVGGAIWGAAAGAFAVIGILQISASGLETITPIIPLVALLGLMAGGVFIGSMIGLFIGWGISSEDEYVSKNLKHEKILMRVILDKLRASAAWQIMHEATTQTRTRQASESSA